MGAELSERRRKAGVAFVFVTVVLDMLAFGLVLPVLPLLVSDMTGGDDGQGATMYGLIGTAWAGLQFLAMPLLGAVSDRVGRRPVLLYSNAGLALHYVILALTNVLWLVFVARVISGIASASVSTANAYVADVTPPEKRAAAFGLMGAAFGVGFVLGPAVGGLLASVDPRLPFWVAAAMSAASFVYGLVILPESLPPEQRSAFDWRKANPVGAFRFLADTPSLQRLAAAKFFYDLAIVALPSTFVLYAAHHFGWGPSEMGLMLGAVGVGAIIVQGGLTGRIVRAIGARAALVLGLVAGGVSFVIYAFSPTPSFVYLGVPVGAFSALFTASLQALATTRVQPHEQGKLQGAFGGASSLASLIGPLLFTSVFAAAIAPHAGVAFPGAPFLVAALLCLVALVISIGLFDRRNVAAEPT